MMKDILRLKYQGGHDRIARSLSISKGAVAKYLSQAGAAGLDWASTVELDEASLERQLMGGGVALSRVVEPDYARARPMRGRYVFVQRRESASSGAAGVARHALAAVQNFHQRVGDARLLAPTERATRAR